MRGIQYSCMSRKIIFFIILVVMIALLPITGLAAQQTITIDGDMSDWTVASMSFSDALGDVNGAGPHDLIKMYITNDANYIYVRWDAIASLADLKSVTYGLALTSIPATGDTRPEKEVLLFIDYDSKSLATVTISNSTTDTILDEETVTNTSPYVRAAEFGTTNKTVAIEARFPLTVIDSLTVNTVDGDATVPLWGATLSSGAFTSVVKDYIPDDGFLEYDMATATYTPVGTGAIAKISGSTLNPKAQPGATINYTVTISNVGTTDNLLFSQIDWTLPPGFTYISGTTTGLTTSNPSGTTGTLTWAGLSGSLPPGDSITLNFQATAAPGAGTFYSQTALTMPSGTINTGDTAAVELQSDYTSPAAPTNLAASDITENSVRLTWDPVADADTYRIYQWGELVATVPASEVTTVISGLSSDTTYEYTVVAVNSSGISSGPSNTVSVTTLAPADATAPTLPGDPSLSTSNETTNSIQVDWEKATDDTSAQSALKYLVYYSTSGDLTTVADIEANGTPAGAYKTDINTLNVSGLTENTLYYFNVIVMDEAGNKTAYTMTSDSTLPMASPVLSASGTTDTSTTLNWTAVTGATSYTVYLDDGLGGTIVSTVPAGTTTLDITGLTQGTDYTYYVVATDGTNSTESNHLTVSTIETNPPTVPAGTTVTASNPTTSSIQVDWNKATDDTSAQSDLRYLVYYSTSDNIGTLADIDANGTAFGSYQTDIDTMTVTGLNDGTPYYFNVVVIDEAGNRTAYTSTDETTLTLGTPVLSASGTTDTSTTLNWTAVTGATSYTVYLDDGLGGTIVSTVPAGTTTLDITGLTQGTDYTYYVVATDGTNSTESNHLTVSTIETNPPTVPAGTTVTASNPTTSSIQVDWNKATDDTSAQSDLRYLVYYSTSDNIGTLADIDANGTAFGSYQTDIDTMTVTGLNDGTPYYFNVVVIDEAGNRTAYTSTDETTLTLGTPVLSASGTTDTSTTLNWTAVTGATSYTVYLDDGLGGTIVSTVPAGTTTLDITGLTQGTDYTYYVVATDGTNSTESNHLTVSTADAEAPSGTGAVTASNPTVTSLDLSWPKATDNISPQSALRYLAYYSTSNNLDTVAKTEVNGTAIGTYATDIDSTAATGLNPSTTYYFNVIVMDEAGNKALYTSGSGTTLTPSAVTLSHSNVAQTTATLTWNAVIGATEYDIYDGTGAWVATVAAPDTTYNLTGLTPHTAYEYTVVARAGAIPLVTSNLTGFTTPGIVNRVDNPQTGYPETPFDWLWELLEKIF